ncbi:MAG: hypothetical protein ACYC2G_08930 [Gemmatimonadaceae bacterium]
MSRSHLYRASGPARPLASTVLAALWCGAALGVLVTAAPLLVDGLPLAGPVAAVLERGFGLIAGTGVFVGLAITAAELFGGRTPARGTRLAGAGLLFLAAGAGLFDNSRSMLRPGTPSAAVSGATANGADAVTAARLRLAWCIVGLAGATLVLGGGLAGLRAQRSIL